MKIHFYKESLTLSQASCTGTFERLTFTSAGIFHYPHLKASLSSNRDKNFNYSLTDDSCAVLTIPYIIGKKLLSGTKLRPEKQN